MVKEQFRCNSERIFYYFNFIFFTLKLLITQNTLEMIVFGFNYHVSSLKHKMFFFGDFFLARHTIGIVHYIVTMIVEIQNVYRYSMLFMRFEFIKM